MTHKCLSFKLKAQGQVLNSRTGSIQNKWFRVQLVQWSAQKFRLKIEFWAFIQIKTANYILANNRCTTIELAEKQQYSVCTLIDLQMLDCSTSVRKMLNSQIVFDWQHCDG